MFRTWRRIRFQLYRKLFRFSKQRNFLRFFLTYLKKYAKIIYIIYYKQKYKYIYLVRKFLK